MTAGTDAARLDVLARLARVLDVVDGPVPDPFEADDVGGGPRVAVLVLATALVDYDEAIRTIRTTWASEHLCGVDVWFVYGNLEQPERFAYTDLRPWTAIAVPDVPTGTVWQSGDVLVAGCADVIWVKGDCLLRKRLAAFDHLTKLDRYDFIATVCATSYFDPAGLLDHIGQLPRHGVFQGPVGVCVETGHAYVSGSCIVMSADVAEQLAAHGRDIIEQNAGAYADDVALSRWVAEHLSDTAPPEIAANIAAGRSPTGDDTFIFPAGVGIDVRSTSSADLLLAPGAFHYHFDRSTVSGMKALHQLHLHRAPTPHRQSV